MIVAVVCIILFLIMLGFIFFCLGISAVEREYDEKSDYYGRFK